MRNANYIQTNYPPNATTSVSCTRLIIPSLIHIKWPAYRYIFEFLFVGSNDEIISLFDTTTMGKKRRIENKPW